MPERSSLFEVCQIGVESSYGGTVAATKQLQSISVTPGVNAETKQYRPRGNKYPTVSVLGKEWTAASYEGPATYTEMVYPLASASNYGGTPTQQGTVAAYSWTFSSDSDGADTISSYSMEVGSSVRAFRIPGAVFTGYNIAFSRKEVVINGDIIGKAINDGVTLTAAGTATVALVPIAPTQVDVYLEDTQAALASGTALTRPLSLEIGLTDRQTPVWALASQYSTSYAALIESEPKLGAKLKMEADAAGMGLMTQLRANSKKWLRVKATGGTIAGTVVYSYTLDMPVYVSSVSEFSDEDGLIAIEWELAGTHDATWGKAFNITIVNGLAGL